RRENISICAQRRERPDEEAWDRSPLLLPPRFRSDRFSPGPLRSPARSPLSRSEDKRHEQKKSVLHPESFWLDLLKCQRPAARAECPSVQRGRAGQKRALQQRRQEGQSRQRVPEHWSGPRGLASGHWETSSSGS